MRFGAISLLLVSALSPVFSVCAAQGSDESDQGGIPWQGPGSTGRISSVAQVTVPDGCRFTGRAGVPAFLEATQNLPDRSVAAVLLCRTPDSSSTWFVLYKYDPSGLVRDTEKNTLDADKILATIKDATDRSNDERERRGWDKLYVTGWITPPFYDETTHNLTWALEGVSSNGESSANRSVRLLGRGGVVSAELVADVDRLTDIVPAFNASIEGTQFVPGQTYGEWREGDKVASYGLVALIAGGAGVAATKAGLFAKLGKLIVAVVLAVKKLIVAAVLGVIAFFKRIFGKKKKTTATPAETTG
ncbi:MAG TPA: DUF2167 domain-containing protein [Gemmatimonadaceae bacterium]|nr:DUF2167 domain-containing protein [Gemmatimonadaceae bacterium]